MYWPVGKSRVLYGNGFATEDGKAILHPAVEGEMYKGYVADIETVIEEEKAI